MRVLALDYGEARCGCALSDPTGTLATPIDAVERPATRRGFARVADLVRERDVEQVVVGLPLGLSGNDTDQTREAREFADRLAERVRPVPVDLYDERFTTSIAAQDRDARTSEDSRAAAVLLEDWLAASAGVHSPTRATVRPTSEEES
jgi:putative Holliday junction resolvase